MEEIAKIPRHAPATGYGDVMMTGSNDDLAQRAVEASFTMFEQSTDRVLLARQMAEFNANHIEAFEDVTSPAYEKLLRQTENLFDFIRKDCQDLMDLDGYFSLLAAYLRDIPISIGIIDEIGRELFSTKFDSLSERLKETLLQATLDNVVNYCVLHRCHTRASQQLSLRHPDNLAFDLSKEEDALQFMLNWVFSDDEPMVFSVLGEGLLAHIFSMRDSSPMFDAAAQALWLSADGERRRISSNSRNNLNEPPSPVVDWLGRNQKLVAGHVLGGTWSTKYHPVLIERFKQCFPHLTQISDAMTLRSYNQERGFLLDLVANSSLHPDKECLDIHRGAYNETPMKPTKCSLEALIAYSLVYKNVLGEDWIFDEENNPARQLKDAVDEVNKRGLTIRQDELTSLVVRAIEGLKRGGDVQWMLEEEIFKPFIRNNRRFQGMRLEDDLGM